MFWKLNKKLIATIINGFKSSIGWNLGKKERSIHLLDPFTSTPTNGTKIKNIKDMKNIIRQKFTSFSLSKAEKKTTNVKLIIIKIKCFKKK